VEQIDKNESNKALWITGIIVVILVIGLITNGFGLLTKLNQPSNKINLEIKDAPVLGDVNAPVTMYVFSDFSCPYCSAADGKNIQVITQFQKSDPSWTAPIPGVINDYVNSRKVKLVFKYAQGHGTGQAAHLVAWCLNDQNLFWKFHDLAFENYEETGDIIKMKDLAESLGADMTQLNTCLDSKKYNYLLTEDSQMASSNGITGTPSFIINGKLIEGAVSFNDIKKVIDKSL
jgi:protein-disulfide isomerase